MSVKRPVLTGALVAASFAAVAAAAYAIAAAIVGWFTYPHIPRRRT